MSYDIIIIGAGTAGMTAALYACRGGMKTLVLEGATYGGQIVVSPEVDNYPGIAHTSGYAFANGLYEQMLETGAEYKNETVIALQSQNEGFQVTTSEQEYKAKSVIIATGVARRKLNLDKEAEFTGQGVSYCATCDGAFFRNRVVAVNGGGNTALEDALFLSGICKKVYVIHRRNEFRAEQAYVQQLKAKENICIMTPNVITELKGEDRLSEIVLQNKITGKSETIAVDGLFIAIGQMPENQIFSELVELEHAGYIVAGEDTKTSSKGIFAAGDCRQKEVRQLTTAAADGAIAATAAIAYVHANE